MALYASIFIFCYFILLVFALQSTQLVEQQSALGDSVVIR